MRLIVASFLISWLAAPVSAQETAPLSLPVVLHVLDGADEARVTALLDTLRESYAPAGIELRAAAP